MAAHRYWRLLFLAGQGGGTTVCCSRLELRETVGGADVVGGGTAAAATALGGWPASNAFNNNNSNSWHSNGGVPGTWLRYDFGEGNEKNIREILYRNRHDGFANEAPLDFDIQFSDDTFMWTTVLAVRGESAWGVAESRVYTIGDHIEPISGDQVDRDDFSAAPVASGLPPRWAHFGFQTTEDATRYEVFEDAGACSGKMLRKNASGTGNAVRGIRLGNDLSPGPRDREVLARVRKTSAGPSNVVIRGTATVRRPSGHNETWQNAYVVSLTGSQIQLIRTEENGNWLTVGTSVSFTASDGTFYWIRARIDGDRVRIKVWASGDAEPGSYQYDNASAIQSGEDTPGWVGIAQLSNAEGMELDLIVVSYGSTIPAGLTLEAPIVATPGGGSDVEAGAPADIEFTLVAGAASYEAEYWDGEEWQAAGSGASSPISWDVPLQNIADALVRVRALADESGCFNDGDYAESSAFNISGALEFIAPTLNETIGGTYNVQFTAVPDADAHQLEYSLNGGVDWIVIDDNITIEPVEGVITYPWDTSLVGNANGVRLRARGVFITELD